MILVKDFLNFKRQFVNSIQSFCRINDVDLITYFHSLKKTSNLDKELFIFFILLAFKINNEINLLYPGYAKSTFKNLKLAHQ